MDVYYFTEMPYAEFPESEAAKYPSMRLIPILDKEGMLWAWRGARPCAPPE